MRCISTIDVQTRLDAQELLNRFCHAIDHQDRAAWLSLFAPGARYDSGYLGSFATEEEIGSIPALVGTKGRGTWRHHFTNLILDRMNDRRHLIGKAFLTTRDCGQIGEPVRFSDCTIELKLGRHWQILRFKATLVGPNPPEDRIADPVSPAAAANAYA